MTALELDHLTRYELSKVGLWRAICKRNPQLALFDETFGGLDSEEVSRAAQSSAAASSVSSPPIPPDPHHGGLDPTPVIRQPLARKPRKGLRGRGAGGEF